MIIYRVDFLDADFADWADLKEGFALICRPFRRKNKIRLIRKIRV